jgi:membrane protease YdiL (CAAX protease family)
VPALWAGATEEVVWRWGVLAGAASLVGWAGGLVLSTSGFAFRHTRSEGLVSYLVLGAAFGGVFVATGRLIAAIVAHAGYNALVFLAGRR